MSELSDVIESEFSELIANLKLRVLVDSTGGWMHESVILEGDGAALSFEKDNMSEQFYVNWLIKKEDALPNPLMSKRIISTDYLAEVLDWPERNGNSMKSVIDWLYEATRLDANSIFSPKVGLVNQALEKQLKDQ
jgi:hypothetical protein